MQAGTRGPRSHGSQDKDQRNGTGSTRALADGVLVHSPGGSGLNVFLEKHPQVLRPLGPLQAPHAMTLLRSKNQEQPPCDALKTKVSGVAGAGPGAVTIQVGTALAFCGSALRAPAARLPGPRVLPTAVGFSAPGQLTPGSAGAEFETSRRNCKQP